METIIAPRLIPGTPKPSASNDNSSEGLVLAENSIYVVQEESHKGPSQCMSPFAVPITTAY